MTQGTEKRQRTIVFAVRLTSDEHGLLASAAERAGLATGSYARQILLGAPAPRQVRRPPIERRELVRLLGELGHIGGNLNQLAHATNVVRPVTHREIQDVLASLQPVRDAILEALGRAP